MPTRAKISGAINENAEADTDAEPAPALRAAASAYWRLWRRNWRAPFPPDDAPPGLWSNAARPRRDPS